MTTTALVTLQRAWDCRWSRLRYPVNRATDAWVCVQTENVARYGRKSVGRARIGSSSPGAARVGLEVSTGVIAAKSTLSSQALRASVRALMMLAAAVFLVGGFAILTRPLAIPLTIALWLGAAAITGFACSDGCQSESSTGPQHGGYRQRQRHRAESRRGCRTKPAAPHREGDGRA